MSLPPSEKDERRRERLREWLDHVHQGNVYCHCGALARWVDSAIVYNGISFGKIYLCSNYPKCDSWVGVHRNSKRPKGTLADKETREARKQAHFIFDTTWKSPLADQRVFLTRKQAYLWMREAMNMEKHEAHIAMMTPHQCDELISKVQGLWRKKND